MDPKEILEELTKGTEALDAEDFLEIVSNTLQWRPCEPTFISLGDLLYISFWDNVLVSTRETLVSETRQLKRIELDPHSYSLKLWLQGNLTPDKDTLFLLTDLQGQINSQFNGVQLYNQSSSFFINLEDHHPEQIFETHWGEYISTDQYLAQKLVLEVLETKVKPVLIYGDTNTGKPCLVKNLEVNLKHNPLRKVVTRKYWNSTKNPDYNLATRQLYYLTRMVEQSYAYYLLRGKDLLPSNYWQNELFDSTIWRTTERYGIKIRTRLKKKIKWTPVKGIYV
jgi:hypothetical protein